MRWDIIKHFSKSEFACPCCGLINISDDLVYKLENARVKAGIPFVINSACRCEKHNADVGGLPNSAHLTSATEKGEASDIACESIEDRFYIVDALLSAGFRRILIYKTFIHADVDQAKIAPIIKVMSC